MSEKMLEFYNKDNMKMIIEIFDNYMAEKHNIQIDTITDVKTHKKFVYDTMNQVYETNKDKSHQQLNVIVLTILREHYMTLVKTVGLQKPNIATLNRDTKIFGNRQVNVNELIPEQSRREEIINPKNLDRLIDERDQQLNVPSIKPDISKLGKPIREIPEDTSSFQRKIDLLQNARKVMDENANNDKKDDSNNNTDDKEIKFANSLDQDMIMDRLLIDNQTQSINNINNHDPKAIFQNPISTILLGSGDSKPFQVQQTHEDTLSNPLVSGTSFLNPRVSQVKKIKKYISINSADRNYELESFRYKYSVNSFADNNDLQRKYRNIQSIATGTVIIPEEIIERVSVTNQNLKQFFNHDFSFAYPYLILSIDEFNDVYDGTNNAVRKAFSKLIYDCYYRSPNGRGYIILKPMQKEKKEFYPAPLSSFGKLSISILKPNGELLNNSADNYKLLKVEYEASNVQYLKIVTDTYFDKNEFFIGDEIIFKNHLMTALNVNMNQNDIDKFNVFINRKEGHEIKQIGTANDYGFFRTFYIQAPGYFDKTLGRYIIDNALIAVLNNYNIEINFCEPGVQPNGLIMNNSLQNTISLRIETLVDDARIFERELL
jgi:hypothetical protein